MCNVYIYVYIYIYIYISVPYLEFFWLYQEYICYVLESN